MAIQLPRAGPGSVGTGVKRARTAQLPDAGDVPRQEVATDPGLAVPDLAQFAGGLGDIGAALSDIGERFQAADERQRKSEESFSRVQAYEEFEEAIETDIRTRGQTRDLTFSGEAEDFGAAQADKIDELLGKFSGSDEHLLRLRAGLAERAGGFTQTMANNIAAAKLAKTNRIVGRQLNRLTKSAMAGESLDTLIPAWQKAIVDLEDNLTIEEELAFLDSGRAALVMAKFEGLFLRGAIDEAEDALDIPGASSVIGGDAEAKMRERISAARQAARGESRVLRPGDVLVGPGGEEIARGAKQPEKLVEIGDGKGGSKFVKESEAEGKPGRPRPPLIQNVSQNEFEKRLGRNDADALAKLEAAASTAQQQLTDITRIKVALESNDFRTGSLGNQRALISRALALFEVPGEEISDLVGNAVTANEIDTAAARLAVQTAQDGGRITNLFITLIRDSLPNLTRTPAGNKILIEVMERLANRKIEVAKLANQFVEEHGSLRPKGEQSFFNAVRALEKSDPVVTEQMLKRIRDESKLAPKSIQSIFQGEETGSIPVPESLRDEPDGTTVRGKTTGKLFKKQGEFLVPVGEEGGATE